MISQLILIKLDNIYKRKKMKRKERFVDMKNLLQSMNKSRKKNSNNQLMRQRKKKRKDTIDLI